MTEPSQSDKPDLRNGIADGDLADGAMLVCQVGDEHILLARRGREVSRSVAACTHYGGPLGEGLLIKDTVRCPLHHACFGLRSGEALAAPALTAASCCAMDASSCAKKYQKPNGACRKSLRRTTRSRE